MDHIWSKNDPSMDQRWTMDGFNMDLRWTTGGPKTDNSWTVDGRKPELDLCVSKCLQFVCICVLLLIAVTFVLVSPLSALFVTQPHTPVTDW